MRLRNSGDALVQDIDLRGGEVAASIEQTGTRMSDALVSRSNTVSDTLPRQRRDAGEDARHPQRGRARRCSSRGSRAFEERVRAERHGAQRKDRARFRRCSATSSPAISANSTAP